MWLYSLFHIFTSIDPYFFMTQLITDWSVAPSVRALQTTNTLAADSAFDVHPKQSQSESIQLLVDTFDLPHTPIFMQQVHGNQVVEYTEPPQNHFAHQADACFTRATGVLCAIMTADCLPVLLTDRAGSFVAAVHCGWRSLYADILTATLDAISSQHELLCWFGPCILQANYEVDPQFVTDYLARHPDCASAFTPVAGGKSAASLYHLATIKLQQLGVRHISQSNVCTFADDRYYSWRQSQTPKRMASMIWLSVAQ